MGTRCCAGIGTARSLIVVAALATGGFTAACSDDSTDRDTFEGGDRSSTTLVAERPPTAPVTIEIVGDEYEAPNGSALNGSAGTHCPPTRDVPSIKPKCWTWSAGDLGEGTVTLVYTKLQADDSAWTIALRAGAGDLLTGEVTARFVSDGTPFHAVGHVNRIPQTMHVTGGSGKFANATGTLTGEGTSTVLAVDQQTGTAHKSVEIALTGDLTFG